MKEQYSSRTRGNHITERSRKPFLSEENVKQILFPGSENSHPFNFYIQEFKPGEFSHQWGKRVGSMSQYGDRISGILLSNETLIWSKTSPSSETLLEAYGISVSKEPVSEIGGIEIQLPLLRGKPRMNIYAETEETAVHLGEYFNKSLPRYHSMNLGVHILNLDEKRWIKKYNAPLGEFPQKFHTGE